MDIRSGSKSVTFKAAVVGAIVLVLMVPLSFLRHLVSERAGLREEAFARVAEGWGGEVTIGGPMIVIPTERTVTDKDGTRVVRSDIHLLPSQLDVVVALKPEGPRYVGIYAVPVYLSDVHLSGRFDLAELHPLLGKEGVRYMWSESRLRLPLSQVRSLREVRSARFATVELKPEPARPGLYRGIEASLDLSGFSGGATFDFTLAIAGSRDFSILPLGSSTIVQVQSAWPHPYFRGAFLPVERQISEQGFTARWQVLELNRSYRQAWNEGEVDAEALDESAFGVGLYQTVDVYQRGERAIKYALLFIALTFLTFFAWEHTARLELHPLQYLLVGLALSTFYLLLIALSEHVAFALAYVLAAVALVLVNAVYVAGALRSSRRGVAVGVAMSVVYGLLYVLVLSEDYALLLGAITLFTALAAVMLITRKVDWYRLGTTS
jgi:inner membrane protein